MAARPKRTEEDRASEGEEDDEEEEDEQEEEGCWEYDSTWEGHGDGDEDDQRPARERSEPAAGSADAASRRKAQDKQQSRWSPGGARWTPGAQEWRRSNLSFRRYKGGGGRNWMAAKDMQKYRRHYPGLEEADVGEQDMWNLSFYKNEIRFLPNGLHIEDLLEVWQNDYATLEENHSYIQWLFPLREQGMNWRARILTCQEIQAFKKSKEVMGRFVRAYKLMLGFYGIDLINEETGELKRAENWRERFENLNMYSHNNLRITRILKCLGEMGFEHYQVHLVKFFLTETLVRQELPRVLKSALDYFMFTVRNKQARQELVHFAWRHFKPKHEFVWGPHKKLRRFKPKPGFLSSLKHGEKQELVLDGAGEAVMTDTLMPPSKVDLEDQAAREGTKEALLQDTNETCVAGHAAGGTGNLTATTKPSLPLNDSVPANDVEEEGISAVGGDRLPAGDVTEHQARPVSEPETLEKTSKPRPAVVEEISVEKGDNEESPPVTFCQLEKKDLSGECGSGTDGEGLKESKKRKLEKSRLNEASAGTGKGPSDIEKISLNLGEVVLDQKGLAGHAFTEEKTEPQVLEGNDDSSRYMKEAELLNTVVKRRKVEDMVVEDGTSNMPVKVDIKIISTESQVTDCSDPAINRTDQTCEGETKTIASASLKAEGVDFPSQSSPDHSFPLDNHLPDEVDKPKIASVLSSEEYQPNETLQSSGEKGSINAREDSPGVEEKAEDPAAANEDILAKTGEHGQCIARAEEK